MGGLVLEGMCGGGSVCHKDGSRERETEREREKGGDG